MDLDLMDINGMWADGHLAIKAPDDCDWADVLPTIKYEYEKRRGYDISASDAYALYRMAKDKLPDITSLSPDAFFALLDSFVIHKSVDTNGLIELT